MQNLTSDFNEVGRFVRESIHLKQISAKSFIVTVFGDVISQHSGQVWLGSLINSLQPLGFSERLIRTSVFRLVKDDWLEVNKIGRKSYYRFTETANKHYTKAARRIYAPQREHPDGNWLIVLPSLVDKRKLPALKKQLSWLGFNLISSGAYAHPSLDQTSLEETIKELDLSDSLIVFSSHIYDEDSESTLRKLVHKQWNIDELHQRYLLLIDDYQKILEQLESGTDITDHDCYLLRLILVHEYRRILLNDYELPQNMLPANWSGYQACTAVKQLYGHLAKPSTRFIIKNMQDAGGYLQKPIDSFKKRFQYKL